MCPHHPHTLPHPLPGSISGCDGRWAMGGLALRIAGGVGVAAAPGLLLGVRGAVGLRAEGASRLRPPC